MKGPSDGTAAPGAYAGDISPKEAWEMLAREPKAQLVDVRTDAEWTYVGLPDLKALGKEPFLAPWKLFPSQQVNADFPHALIARFPARDTPLLFLCRSGVRSRAAAVAMTQLGYGRCYNVAHGFEGDRDDRAHRNTKGGWRVDGLPWAQS
ncbi:MAG: rhodanese-like domain-containing protein [Alphaproteobacteria bacterium]|nr:rhodanese-like domain-containing protein [Alphaproteobacteria bacterium]MBM3952915.1 rhodanese-like domain-containing protein [Rhodospirillales bacterium]